MILALSILLQQAEAYYGRVNNVWHGFSACVKQTSARRLNNHSLIQSHPAPIQSPSRFQSGRMFIPALKYVYCIYDPYNDAHLKVYPGAERLNSIFT